MTLAITLSVRELRKNGKSLVRLVTLLIPAFLFTVWLVALLIALAIHSLT